jgi:hypothetical protein
LIGKTYGDETKIFLGRQRKLDHLSDSRVFDVDFVPVIQFVCLLVQADEIPREREFND